MAHVNASEAGPSGPSAYATYRDTSLAKLEDFMEEAKLLAAERISLGSSTADKRRKEAIAEKLADIRGNVDALRLCIDGQRSLYERHRALPEHGCVLGPPVTLRG
jgi:hypothetical protein